MAKSQNRWNKIYQKQRNNQLMRAWNKSKKEVISSGQRYNQNLLAKTLIGTDEIKIFRGVPFIQALTV